jgi:hypothetical protein
VPPIYRAPMRSREGDAPAFDGARFAVEHGLVGIGGPLEIEPEDLDEAVEVTAVTHGPKPGRMLERFAALSDGTLVWTRTGEEEYRLGRIGGPWRWDSSAAARTTGIQNVRDAVWLPRTFGPDEVPAAVAATFARGGRNLQRTHDADAERLTARLWEEHAP